MHRVELTSSDGFGQEYLQISANIFSILPARVSPISYYRLDPALNAVRPINPARKKIPPAMAEELKGLCQTGDLFLSTNEYKAFAEHLAGHLGVLLTEHILEDYRVSKLFHHAFVKLMNEFIAQSTEANLDRLRNNLAIFCEYLWTDSGRLRSLFQALRHEHDLAVHSTNTLFVGLAIFIHLNRAMLDSLYLGNLALGLLLHDIGMATVPKAILGKDNPLVNREVQSVRQHIEVGSKILTRLKVAKEEVLLCLMEHHEREDGRGYPLGLKENGLSLPGRICAVADSYCAMTAERPHSPKIEPVTAAQALLNDGRYLQSVTSALSTLLEQSHQESTVDQHPIADSLF